MKFKAIITQRDGGRVILELSCREYHAQKLKGTKRTGKRFFC